MSAGVARGQPGLAGAALGLGQFLGQGQPGTGSRTDRVGGHAVATQIAGQRAGQADDALLGGGVVGLAHVAQPGLGRCVHDPTRALLAEDLGGELGHREVTLEVDVDDDVPLVLGHVEDHPVAQDAGVVDQDVEPAERVERLLDHALAGVHVGHRVVVGDGVAAGVLDRGHDLVGRSGLAVEFAALGAAVVVDHDPCALRREQQGVSAANPAAGAGHDRDAAIKSITHEIGVLSEAVGCAGRIQGGLQLDGTGNFLLQR